MTIAEVKKLETDMPVLDVRARVKTVYARKTGITEDREWSYQDLLIEDTTGSIYVKCQNKIPLDELKGKDVLLTCYKSDKHGWVGLTTFDDDYSDPAVRKLKMTKTGVITLLDEVPERQETSSQKPQDTTYWNNKLELDKARLEFDKSKQIVICRQNALTAAIEFSKDDHTKEEIVDTAEYFATWTHSGIKIKEETKKDPF